MLRQFGILHYGREPQITAMWDAATSNAQNRAMLNVGEASIYLAMVRDTQPCEPPKTLQTAGSTDDTGSGKAHGILCTSQIRNRAKESSMICVPASLLPTAAARDATTQQYMSCFDPMRLWTQRRAILHMHRKDRHVATWVNDALRHPDAAPDALPEARPVD
ncbi:hypothetical protein CH63R_05443 [Colletotrichum higginsianum IMI 349063]|uniref:Uncharacterized protein n=1 Tax=Colletotrichum higginsianum (strain IMI 349063) TaxID=759273 RepID=A0A1B7YC96_COLHI|nr:hypothetical protein CH63R_05443 [Colletotrichum higginsianum IMI 349063]OBR09751.1 hypothetical protein CH63R_05443 [Colletotrichum higginsianum IMI 349063]